MFVDRFFIQTKKLFIAVFLMDFNKTITRKQFRFCCKLLKPYVPVLPPLGSVINYTNLQERDFQYFLTKPDKVSTQLDYS